MATRTIKRKAAFNWADAFTQHLVLKLEAAGMTKRSEVLKKRLKEDFPTLPDLYENENGSKFVDLPETFTVHGKTFKGMELRRSVPVKFDEEEAEKILKRKGLYEEALSTYVDQDKVVLLQQEGKITDKDIDKMFIEGESWSFWAVEGEVE